MACAAPPAKAPVAALAMTCALVLVALSSSATADSEFTILLDTPFFMASVITDRAKYDQQVMNMSGYITKVLFDTTIGNADFPGTSVQYTVKKNLPSGAATVRQATDPTHIATMRNMKQPIKTNCDPTVYTCTRTPCGVIEMDYLSASTDDAGNINRHFVVTGSTPPLAKVDLYGWSMCGPMFGYNSTIPAAVAAMKYPNSVLNYNGHSMTAPKISMPNNIVTKMNTYPRWLYNTTTDWIFGNKRSKTLVCSSKTLPPYTQTPKGLSYQVGVMPFTSRQVGDPSDKFNQNLFKAAQTMDDKSKLMPLKNFTDIYADAGLDAFYRTDAFAALHRCVALKMLVSNKIADNKPASIHSPDPMHEPETVKGCPNTRPLAQATDGTKPAWGLNPNTYAQNKQTYGFWDTHATTDYDGSDTAFARNSVLWTDGSLERSRILNMGYRGTALDNHQKNSYGQLTDEHMRVNITNPKFGTGCMNELFMMENVSSGYTPQHFTVYYKGGSSVPPETNGYETWDNGAPGWFRISALQMFNRSRSDLKKDDPTMHYRAAEWDIWSVNSLGENGIRHLGAPTKKLKTGFPDYTNPPAASVFATNPGYCVLNRCMGGRRDTPTALAEQAYGRFGTDDKWLYDAEKHALSCSTIPDKAWCNSLSRVQRAVKHINDSGAYGYGIDESFANWAHIGCNQKVQAIKDNSDDTVSSVHKLFLDSSTNIPVRISVIGSVIRGCNLAGTKSIKSNTNLWERGKASDRTNGRSSLAFENDDSLNVVLNPTAYDYSKSNPPGYKIWKRDTKTYPNQVPTAKYGWEAWWTSSSSGKAAYTAYNPYWDGINYLNYSCPMGFKTGSGTKTNEMQLSKNSFTPYRYQMDIVCTQDNTPTDPADWTDNKRWWKQHQLLYSIEEVTECSTPVDEELYAAGDNPYEHSHRTLVRPVISTMMFKRDTPTAGADSYGRYKTPSYPGETIKNVQKYKMDYPHTYGFRDTEALIYTQYSDYQKGAVDQSDSICPVFGNTGGTCAWLPEAPTKAGDTLPGESVCCDAINIDYNSAFCVTKDSDPRYIQGTLYNSALDQQKAEKTDHPDLGFYDNGWTYYDVTNATPGYDPIDVMPTAFPEKTAIPPAVQSTACDCGMTTPAYYCYSMPWVEALNGVEKFAIAAIINSTVKTPVRSSVLKWCGYGWKDMININTPPIGLYLQSRTEPFLVYDRDVLNTDDLKQNNPDAPSSWNPDDGIREMLFQRESPGKSQLESATFTAMQRGPKSTGRYKYSFLHQCVRWPYGQISQFELDATYTKAYYPTSTMNKDGETYDFQEGALLNYCEQIESSPTGTDADDHSTVLKQMPFCNNDPMSVTQRQAFCSEPNITVITMGLGIGYRALDHVCSEQFKYCFVVPGSQDWGTVANILRVDRDYSNYTMLISPFNITVYESMLAFRFHVDTLRPDNAFPYNGMKITKGTALGASTAAPMQEFRDFYVNVLDTLSVNVATAIKITTNMMDTLRGSTVNILPLAGSELPYRTVAFADLKPPITEIGIRIMHPGITIRSASANDDIVMARTETAVRKVSTSTCTRFFTGRAGFTITGITIDMQGCGNLPSPEKIPIYMVGDSAAGSSVNITLTCSGPDACIVPVAVALLGDASSFMPSKSYISIQDTTIRVCNDIQTGAVVYVAAFARVNGNVTVYYDHNTKVILQDTVNQPIGEHIVGVRNNTCGSDPSRIRRDTPKAPVFTILNVTKYTSVFGDAIEQQLFSRPVDVTVWYVPVIIITLTLVVGLGMFQLALCVHGESARRYILSRCVTVKPVTAADGSWKVYLAYDKTNGGHQTWMVDRKGAAPTSVSDVIADIVSGVGSKCDKYPEGLREVLFSSCKKEL